MSNRFAVFVDGKWQGGSFATEAEAKAEGERQPKPFEVRPKGGVRVLDVSSQASPPKAPEAKPVEPAPKAAEHARVSEFEPAKPRKGFGG